MMCDALLHAAAIVIAACIVADQDTTHAGRGYRPRRGVLPPPPHGGSGVSKPARPKR